MELKMAIDFPNSPVLNDTFTVGSSVWQYDGAKWLSLGITGPTGATGVGYSNVTSTSTVSIVSSGNVGFTVPNTGAFQIGDYVRVSNSAATAYMEGTVTTGTVTNNNIYISVNNSSGSGSYSSWRFSFAGVIGPTGATGPTGNTGPAGADGSWATTQLTRSVTGSTDTPTSADNGKLITIDTTSSTVTIFINSSLGLSAGQRIDFAWLGAATAANFSPSSTTINATPGLKLRARYSAATLLCVGSNSYLLVGDLSA